MAQTTQTNLATPESVPIGWELSKVGSLVKRVNEKRGDIEPEPTVLSCSKDYGLIPQLELFKRRVAALDTRRYKLVGNGDFVYDPNLLWSGAISRSRQQAVGIVSPVYEVFRVDHGSSQDFLHAWFMSPSRLPSYRAISMGTNVRRRRADFGDFCQLSILLPPLPEQHAIAAVLDSIDEAIERTEAVIAATERLRDALLHELLTRGVPGWHAEWKEVPGVGTIPASWEVVRLGDVAEVAFSTVDKKTVDGEVPVQLCNYTDVFYNRRIFPDMAFMHATATLTERERWSLKRGDVLFTKDSESPDEIGIPTYVTEDMPNVVCGYHLGLARPNASLVDGAFLAETLRSPAAERQFARIANGVTRFGLTLGATRSFSVCLPSLEEQEAIAALLDAADDGIERGQAEREGLLSLKASAADVLLTGRVRAVR